MSDNRGKRFWNLLGWVFFVSMAFPYLFSDITEELCRRFQAFCEATVQWIWDGSEWKKVYNEELEL